MAYSLTRLEIRIEPVPTALFSGKRSAVKQQVMMRKNSLTCLRRKGSTMRRSSRKPSNLCRWARPRRGGSSVWSMMVSTCLGVNSKWKTAHPDRKAPALMMYAALTRGNK
jgi:hypothetical protein